jgi:hypothetical protein
MEYRDFTKATSVTDDNPSGLLYFRAEFENRVLRIYYPVKDANGVEEYVLGMVQPYKFDDIGTQIAFIDAEDAFSWLEAVKQRVV